MQFIRFYHFFFGILNAIALIAAFNIAFNSHTLEIYFSYFTILSNILITILFVYFALMGKNIGPKNKILANLYGAAVLYMSITGVVFWTLLRNDHAVSPTEWITFILHGIMPVATLVGWVIYSPKLRFSIFDCLKWLSFPIIFVIYTLIRGPIVHWYPYPFLNPSEVGGYLGISKYIVIILLGSFFVSQILIWISNTRLKKSK